MHKRTTLLFIAIAGLALYAGWWLYWLTLPRAPAKNTPAAFFEHSLVGAEGEQRKLAQWRGKYVLVNFWATWCPPCLEEIPLLVEAQQQYGGDRLQVVGVTILSAANQLQEIEAMQGRLKMNYPILMGSLELFDWMKVLGNEQGGLPFSVLLAPDGNILARKRGPYQKLELEKLLADLPL